MEPVILTWNFTNWVTVVLMALIGFLIFSLVVQGIVRVKSNSSGAQANG